MSQITNKREIFKYIIGKSYDTLVGLIIETLETALKQSFIFSRPDQVHALLVGVDKYESFKDVLFASKDIFMFLNFLMNRSVPPENIKILTDENYKFKNDDEDYISILNILDQSSKNSKEEKEISLSSLPFKINILYSLEQKIKMSGINRFGTFIFYFSGHGLRYNEKDFIITKDSLHSSNLEHTSLSIDLLADYIDKIQADLTIIIFDACRSLIIGRGETSSNFGDDRTRFKTDRERIFIYSCGPKEISTNYKDKKQGTFSYYLIKGLEGEARNKMGFITSESLKKYLEKKVKTCSDINHGILQNPKMYSSSTVGRSNFIFYKI